MKIRCPCCGFEQSKFLFFKNPKKYQKIEALKDKEYFWEDHCKDCREEIVLFKKFKERFEGWRYNLELSPPFSHGQNYDFFNIEYSMRWIRLERELCKFVSYDYPEIIDEDIKNDYYQTISNIAAFQLKILNERNIVLVNSNPYLFSQSYFCNVWFPHAYWTTHNNGAIFLCQTHSSEKIYVSKSQMNEGEYESNHEDCKKVSKFKFRKDLEIDNSQFDNLYTYLSN